MFKNLLFVIIALSLLYGQSTNDPTKEYQGSFGNAFIQARLELGPGQSFKWNGNKYTTDITDEYQVPLIYREIEALKSDLSDKSVILNSSISKANTQIDTLEKLISKVSNLLDSKTNEIDKTINMRTIIWVITLFVIVFAMLLLHIKFRKRFSDHDNSFQLIRDNHAKLEKESVALESKIIDVLDKSIDHEKLKGHGHGTPDHSLPLKLGEELFRMKKRLGNMEESHGTKVLNARIESLEEKLNDLGYEIINLLNKPYNEGMELANAQFIANDTLKADEKIITRVIKPQINYKGVLIKSADVEVSQGS